MMKPSPLSAISLPCGRTLSNRLAKVAMYEHLADFYGGSPNNHHCALYEAWSQAPWGYGMVMTGNVMVASGHLTLGRDIVLPAHITEDSLAPFQRLAGTIHSSPESLAIMQLSHSGRQSSRVTGVIRAPLAPSAIPVGRDVPWSNFFSKLLYSCLFQTPRVVSVKDIEHVVSRFVFGAQVAHQSGFDGIQLHAAHGCMFLVRSVPHQIMMQNPTDLLAQFMSPETNRRTDRFSAEVGNDLRLLHTIVSGIRRVVPEEFVVSVKLNAGDYTKYSDDSISPRQEKALNHIKSIAQWGGVDFIEISGGDYESPDFVSERPKSQRQAFFSHISSKAIKTLESMPRSPESPPLPLILLTGGLRSPASLHSALESNHAQLLGIGRSAVICPNIPAVLNSLGDDPATWPDIPFGPEPNDALPRYFPKIPLLGAGGRVAWYEMQMRYLSQRTAGHPQMKMSGYPDYTLTARDAIVCMWFWTTDGSGMSAIWRLSFCLAFVWVSIYYAIYSL